jgi:regulator of sigma E protease
MSVLFYVVAILGLAFLMVVHEAGHFLVARFFGMRVTRFSIGFGPAIWKKQPEGSPTTYQVAIIPFLAYVQIAGMNPFEDIDPDDKGSYANARLHARVLTIFAGPLANYLAASVVLFVAFMIGGQKVLTTSIQVIPDTPAAAAHLQEGDTVLEVDGQAITAWEQLPALISTKANQPVKFVIDRRGERVTLEITPAPTGEGGRGVIGIKPLVKSVPMTVGEAAVTSLKEPPIIVANLVVGIGQMIARKVKPELSGPVGIVSEIAEAARRSFADYLQLVAGLSAYLAGFNLLPVPALDGGRLLFLGYEAATRRRANARVEAGIHFVGLAMLLMLVAAVTFGDVGKLFR